MKNRLCRTVHSLQAHGSVCRCLGQVWNAEAKGDGMLGIAQERLEERERSQETRALPCPRRSSLMLIGVGTMYVLWSSMQTPGENLLRDVAQKQAEITVSALQRKSNFVSSEIDSWKIIESGASSQLLTSMAMRFSLGRQDVTCSTFISKTETRQV